jgi:hypothetical protein
MLSSFLIFSGYSRLENPFVLADTNLYLVFFCHFRNSNYVTKLDTNSVFFKFYALFDIKGTRNFLSLQNWSFRIFTISAA